MPRSLAWLWAEFLGGPQACTQQPEAPPPTCLPRRWPRYPPRDRVAAVQIGGLIAGPARQSCRRRRQDAEWASRSGRVGAELRSARI